MLTCLKYRKRLGAFLDGELPHRKRVAVERHLAKCGSCRAVLTELRRLEPLLSAGEVPPVPAALAGRIKAAAMAAQKTRARVPLGRWWWETWTIQPWALKGATAAALVVGLTIGGYMGWTSNQDERLAQYEISTYGAEAVDGPLYAFQSLGAAPRGSMVAATLELMDYGGR
jgi:anti-sigma factor RsiW